MKLKSFAQQRNHKQDKKTTLRMGENFANETTDKGLISKICKQLMQLNINKQPNTKMGRRLNQTFLQRRYTDCQQTHEKMLNITNH